VPGFKDCQISERLNSIIFKYFSSTLNPEDVDYFFCFADQPGPPDGQEPAGDSGPPDESGKSVRNHSLLSIIS